MNDVCKYLRNLRAYCVNEYFSRALSRYVGNDQEIVSAKRFFESFIRNSIFDENSELYVLANRYMASKSYDCSVKSFASFFYDYITKNEELYLNPNSQARTLAFREPNFKAIKDASQVLNILRKHFTILKSGVIPDPEMKDYLKTFDKTLDNPKNWNYLDQSIIRERLKSNGEIYPYDCCHFYSCEGKNERATRFILASAKKSNQFLAILSNDTMNSLLEFLKSRDVQYTITKFGKKEIKISFTYRCDIYKHTSSRCHYSLTFHKNSNNYYTLISSITEKYERMYENYFEVEKPGGKYIVCLEPLMNHLLEKKEYEEYDFFKIDAKVAVVFE